MPFLPRTLGLLLAGALTAGLLVGPSVGSAQAVTPSARSWPGHPHRHVITYRVRHGDSATRIARHFHAWTAELLRINHKTRSSYWIVGERVLVPVVTKRARHPRKHPVVKHHSVNQPRHPGRARVRAEVIRVARAHGVRPRLALAVAWQESRWQQHVRSPVGAVGTMQVMPGTGRYLSRVLGRPLHLGRLHDNVLAGVTLLRLLHHRHGVRVTLAGYYQGLGSVQASGLYPSTRRYIASVLAHQERIRRGWNPAR